MKSLAKRHFVVLIAAVIGTACGDPQSPPSSPTVNHDIRLCNVGKSSFWDTTYDKVGWYTAVDTLHRSTCNELVLKTDTAHVPILAVILVDTNQFYSTPNGSAEIRDTYSGSLVAGDVGYRYPMSPLMGVPDFYQLELAYTPQLGTYKNPSNSAQFRDSMRVEVTGVRYGGTIWAWGTVLGNISNVSHSLVGPTTLSAGSSREWYMYTAWDTVGYRYQWTVDGSPVAGGDHMSTTFTSHGSHSIKSISIRADDTADTVTTAIAAQIGVSVSGDQNLNDGDTGNWTAMLAGAHSPYTCTWSLDYSTVQTGSCSYSHSFDGPSTHYLDVSVTDTDSGAGSSPIPSFTVSVHNVGGGPDYLREPAGSGNKLHISPGSGTSSRHASGGPSGRIP